MKLIVFIPIDAHVEGHGYRVSIVIEGEDGHRPTGNWPYSGKVGESMPWFWGDDYDVACRLAEEHNERCLGISKEEAYRIVSKSMGDGIKNRRGRARKGKSP